VFKDMSKFFNAEQMTKAFQQNMDMRTVFSASQQSVEAMKKAGSVMADTMSTCLERQMQMLQNAMEDNINTMQEFSSAKGIEDLMNKQNQAARKAAEKAQKNSQELAQIVQKGQAKAADILAQQMAQAMDQVQKQQQASAPASK
jgi:phasin family protein